MPDDLDEHIAWARSEMALQRKSTVTVSRVTGPKVFDPVTGQYATPTVTVYTGACKVRPASREGVDAEAGEGEIRRSDYEAKFPPDTPIESGDIVVVTESEWDEGMVGRRFRVSDSWVDEWQVNRVATIKADGTEEVES